MGNFLLIKVAQDVDGRHPDFRHIKNQQVSMNQLDSEREAKLLPIQMMCLWNGMVSINATIFNHIEFRRGLNGKKEDRSAGECSASEITSLCLDMIKYGHNKIMMVPQVKVAYDLETYKFIKHDDTFFTQKYKPDAPHNTEDTNPIQFRNFSKEHECWPYFTGDRGRERHSREEYSELLPTIEHRDINEKRVYGSFTPTVI